MSLCAVCLFLPVLFYCPLHFGLLRACVNLCVEAAQQLCECVCELLSDSVIGVTVMMWVYRKSRGAVLTVTQLLHHPGLHAGGRRYVENHAVWSKAPSAYDSTYKRVVVGIAAAIGWFEVEGRDLNCLKDRRQLSQQFAGDGRKSTRVMSHSQ